MQERGLTDEELNEWRAKTEDFLSGADSNSKVLKSQEAYERIVQVISPGGWDKIPTSERTKNDYRYIQDYVLIHRNACDVVVRTKSL